MARFNVNEKITCACGKTFSLKNRARHNKSKKHLNWENRRELGPQPPTGVKNKDKKDCGRGLLFYCSWTRSLKYPFSKGSWKSSMKYPLCKKMWRRESEITGLAIGNEFLVDHTSRCHALIKTKKKMSLKAFGELLKSLRIRQPDSLIRCKNVRVSVRRITNRDKFAMFRGFPLSDTSTLYRAAKYASCNKTVDYNQPIANTITRHNRSLFESAFKYYRDQIVQNWHKQLIQLIKDQPADKILWIHDSRGNNGQVHIVDIMETRGQAFVISGDGPESVPDTVRPLIVFDYSRETSNRVNLSLINACTLLNHRPKVIVFSRFLPIALDAECNQSLYDIYALRITKRILHLVKSIEKTEN